MLTGAQIEKLLSESRKTPCGCGTKKPCVTIEAIAALPSRYGKFQVVAFKTRSEDKEHAAFIHGNCIGKKDVPVRIHSECLTGDVAGSLRCDCHEQLVSSLKRIGKMKTGILLYLRQEGRGIGLINKIKAYMLQDHGLDTFQANQALGFRDDERDFSAAAHMLNLLRVKSVQLMTNNPEKISELERFGIMVTKRIPLLITPGRYNKFYLKTKETKGGHLLNKKSAPRRRKRS